MTVHLADCVGILKPSPGRLASDLRNRLPRRDRHSAEFLAVKARIMEEMRHHGVAQE
jgi:ABC-type nitrate/sulfonate/bicarbonate transport system ATPase subunit